MSDVIAIGQDGFYHPTNEQQIIAIIQEARARGQQVRVRGSGHSVAAAVYTSNFQKGMAGASGFNLMLDQMRAVTFHEETAASGEILVTAEAGCNLGQDPHDPSATSTWANSLFAQINAKGWAFPDTGGIIHQTVAGFISTGSAGGSLEDSVGDAIHAIRFIDGTGQVQYASREKNPELFEAAGVSLGLLGIITAVTFRCVRNFAIQGTEVTSSVQACAIDLFGPGDKITGKPSLQQFLEQTEYARLLWWPQRGVEKMVVWQGKRIPYDPNMKVEPYVEIGRRFDKDPLLTLLTQVLGQAAGSAFYTLVGTWPQWVHALLGNREVRLAFQEFCKKELDHSTSLLQHLFDRPTLRAHAIDNVPALSQHTTSNGTSDGIPTVTLPKEPSKLLEVIVGVLEWLGKLYDEEKPVRDLLDKLLGEISEAFISWVIDKFVQDGTQTFQDFWYAALPMDNQISDVRMPTEFTELWVPLSQTQEVMNVLRKHYEEGGMAATGTYSCEIYSAKESKYWLSPSYGEPVVRIDIFWFAYNLKDPSLSYYPQFWKLLAPYNFRPHWAKYLPDPSSATGVNYLRALYPKWQDFMQLREKMDPDQLFVTDYWRWHLDIPAAVPVKLPATSAA